MRRLNGSGNDEDRLKMFLQSYPSVTVVEQEIPTVRLAIVLQGKVMYDGPNPLGILIIILLYLYGLIIVPKCLIFLIVYKALFVVCVMLSISIIVVVLLN